MGLINCPECNIQISKKAFICPKCGNPMKANNVGYIVPWRFRGFQWRSSQEIMGWPLVHIAFGRDKKTGKLLIAKGIIAIGQFAIGVITIAQFGIGFLFGFGQFIAGMYAVAQFALGVYFGLGQFAIGLTAIGQFAIGKYVRALTGIGQHVWSAKIKDPQAIEYFRNFWAALKNLLG